MNGEYTHLDQKGACLSCSIRRQNLDHSHFIFISISSLNIVLFIYCLFNLNIWFPVFVECAIVRYFRLERVELQTSIKLFGTNSSYFGLPYEIPGFMSC